MFSGFRSILFGDAETQPPVNSASTNELMQSDETNHRASVNETTKAPPSVSLEQTFNAATTKFTEQLLPQQASIEQLQSSSHQLLPSLNEQQEQQVVEIVAQKCGKYMKDDDDDEDDELIADSWELLDLVESKKLIDGEDQDDDGIQIIYNEQPGSSADVNEQQQQLCKSTSGILKSSNNGSVKQQQHQQARQKPKVSFNTPDLVKSKRQNNNKIERASGSKQVANKSTDKPQANKATGKANKKDKQATRRANKMAKKPSKLLNLPSNQISAKSDTEDVVPYLSGPKEDIKDNNQATSLNYAAAVLASKQNLDSTCEAIEKGKQQELAVAQGNGGGDDLQPIKSIKRHRVNSNDNIASNYEYLKAAGVGEQVEVNDDTESIVSSGFSDCDYEFKGLDDYVMRPKRNITKRGRNKSTNLSQYAKRKSASSSGPSKSSDGSKNNKIDGGLSDIASKVAAGSPSKASKASKATNKKRRELDGSSTDVLKADDNHKQQPAAGSSCNSNDSSDVADMDESWYVTPPPCFTGANRLNSTDNDDEEIGCANGHKQAANNSNLTMISETPASAALIENELIEHPSIYIASTSTSSKTKDVFVGENFKKSPTNKKTQPKSIVLRKVKLRRESATKAAEQSHNSGSNKLFKVCSRDDVVANEDEALMSDDLDEFWSDGPAKRRQVAVRSKQQVVASELAAVKCEQPKVEFVEQEKSKSDSKVATVAASSSKPIRKSTGGKPAQVYKQMAPSSSGSSIGSSSAATVAVNQNKSTVAWRNKFIVDDWDLDDQEDPTTSDFDVMFEPVRKKKAVAKSKRKQQKLQVCAAPLPPPLEQPGAVVELDGDVISANLGDESIQADSQMESTAATTASSDEAELDEPAKENEQPAGSLPDGKFALLVTSAARKPATQVKPIEPERKPGWQLKRRRSKRRCSASLSNGSPASAKTTTTLEHEQQRQQQQQRRRLAKSTSSSSSSSLASSPTSVVGGALEETNGNSARSTPTLIDRIGSSIVANLSNLTGGFVPVNAMLIQAATSPSGSNARNLLLLDQHHSQHNSASGGGGVLGEQRNRQQQQQQALASRADKLATVGEARANRLVARKQLARNSLRRQNGVARGQSSQRRADRRLRMFARPNGCSVNRKVQTNY